MDTNTLLSPNSLKKLTSQELIERTRSAAANERVLQAEVIRLLAEIDRRRLFASLGYRSLFDFCVKELHYSESAAWRRIAAMRVLSDLPGAEGKLVTGELNLKKLTSLQTFFATEERHNKKTFTLEQKKQIMESVENKSGRETDAILASLSPVPHSPFERERPLNEVDVEIRFVADVPLLGKLHRLKDLNSHRDPSRSYKGLFEWLSDLGLKTSDPLLKAVKSGSSSPRSSISSSVGKHEVISPVSKASPLQGSAERTRPDRYIPTGLKLKIWKRDQGKCTYIDPRSGRRCGATSFIEIDHIVPHALGGETTLENLRLYCRTHNLEAARKTYGDQKIQSEIRASQRQSHSNKGLS